MPEKIKVKELNGRIGSGWVRCKSEAAAKRVYAEIGTRKARFAKEGRKYPFSVKKIKDVVFLAYVGEYDEYIVFDLLTDICDEFFFGKFNIMCGKNEFMVMHLQEGQYPILVSQRTIGGDEND